MNILLVYKWLRYLPGHLSVLQFWASALLPTQSLPRGAKASNVQFLSRLLIPVPHVNEQADQDPHSLKTPSTKIWMTHLLKQYGHHWKIMYESNWKSARHTTYSPCGVERSLFWFSVYIRFCRINKVRLLMSFYITLCMVLSKKNYFKLY